MCSKIRHDLIEIFLFSFLLSLEFSKLCLVKHIGLRWLWGISIYFEGTISLTVIDLGNGIGDPSSNPGQNSVLFT